MSTIRSSCTLVRQLCNHSNSQRFATLFRRFSAEADRTSVSHSRHLFRLQAAAYSLRNHRSVRQFASTSGRNAKNVSEGEQNIRSILQKNFPGACEVEVEDVSGGCGSMFQIYIEAEEFRGKGLVEQQRMVNAVLEREIKAMHGLTLQTAIPKKTDKAAFSKPPVPSPS